MSPHLRTLLAPIGAIGILGAVMFALSDVEPKLSSDELVEESQVASAGTAQTAESQVEKGPAESSTPVGISPIGITSPESSESATASRIVNPYPFPPEAFTTINQRTFVALVNILCTAQDSDIQSISGSGVIIDPRGIILTNAHIAQYVLLAQSGQTSLSCIVQSGFPARPLWSAEVLYIPPVWIQEHAPDIASAHPVGTGEHDYALLRITNAINPEAESAQTIALPFDVREAIAFQNDLVLSGSYPAEFIGDTPPYGLLPLSSISKIEELLTFSGKNVDMLSLGNTPVAQSGSSGGPVVNAWGRVVGLITTTSASAVLAERELRAITTSYINRDLIEQTGSSLEDFLSNDIAKKAAAFREHQAPMLIKQLINAISH